MSAGRGPAALTAPGRYRRAVSTMIVVAENEPSALSVPIAATCAPAARLATGTAVSLEIRADAGTATVVAAPALDATESDEPVVMAAVSFTSIVYTLMNLGVDLLYGWLDPRVRQRA